MHDIRWIRDNPDAFDRALARRGLSGEAARLIGIDERRRTAIQKAEAALARRNAASREIGAAKKSNEEERAQKLMAEVAQLKDAIPALEAEAKAAGDELDKALAEIPNLPLDEVPDGASADDNVEHHHFGAKRNYAFTPKQHFELGEALGQMDFETAAKLSGARFVVLKSGLARMERATRAVHARCAYARPWLYRGLTAASGARRCDVRDSAIAEVCGRSVLLRRDTITRDEMLQDASEVRFWSRTSEEFRRRQDRSGRRWSNAALARAPTKEDYWLIPTAEVPLTNLVRESIVDEAELPMRLTACTPCFRAEAGAAGKDTRGMIRQHQFTKVELVSITTPEQSKDEHERMLACAEEVLRRLDLHYRVVTLCTGDMGFASQKTYDIEVWLPGQNMYREISSCSVLRRFPGPAHERALPTEGRRRRASCTRSTAPASPSAARSLR